MSARQLLPRKSCLDYIHQRPYASGGLSQPINGPQLIIFFWKRTPAWRHSYTNRHMKRPGDNEPEPEGGRAAERLREFLRERLPQDVDTEEGRQLTDAEDAQNQTASKQQSSSPPQP